MIHFLGGPPRVGKSIIAGTITRQHGVSAVSTDSLGVVLEAVLDADAAPGLFAVTRFNEMAEADRVRLLATNSGKRIRWQVEESTAVWRAVEPFVLREQEEGRDLVVEGVAVLPELVNQLVTLDYQVVFVGNQENWQSKNIRASARENKHDWMQNASDEYIDAFVSFVVEMSSYVETEARRYGFRYIEMGGRRFDQAVAEVVDSLLG